uniref:(northern house mosquito) hypothetical protein n=1 Tax=Culex pipiens TaxID=7175 RepID=A0A8D8G0W8_CULPI
MGSRGHAITETPSLFMIKTRTFDRHRIDLPGLRLVLYFSGTAGLFLRTLFEKCRTSYELSRGFDFTVSISIGRKDDKRTTNTRHARHCFFHRFSFNSTSRFSSTQTV